MKRVVWCALLSCWYYLIIVLASDGDAPRPDGNQSSTTFSDGCLGSHNDEERSEMRYVMRIARPRESLKF